MKVKLHKQWESRRCTVCSYVLFYKNIPWFHGSTIMPCRCELKPLPLARWWITPARRSIVGTSHSLIEGGPWCLPLPACLPGGSGSQLLEPRRVGGKHVEFRIRQSDQVYLSTCMAEQNQLLQQKG